jgi:type I restriction enzyme R subunit
VNTIWKYGTGSRSAWHSRDKRSDCVQVVIALITTPDGYSARSSARANVIEQGETAARQIDLDEAATRQMVHQQLRDRGSEADAQKLTYANGARPAKGRAMAIAEWPTESGPTDYALFVGLTRVAVIEAKRKRKNVSAAIDQAERYACGFTFANGEPAGGPGRLVGFPSSLRPMGVPTSNKSRPRAAFGFGIRAKPPINAVPWSTRPRLTA